jgi:hypothetical protein
MESQSIRDMQRRGQQYWYEDGLWELTIGLLFVFYAAYYGVVGLLPQESGLRSVLSVGYIVVVPGAMLVASWIVRRLKERITAPRTGHIAVVRSRHIVQAAILAVVVGGATVAAALLIESLYVPVLVGGGGMAIALGITTYRVGIKRMIVPAIVSLIAGFVLSVTTSAPEPAFSFLFGSVGLVIAALGALTFSRYLRRNSKQQDEENEER